MAKIYFKMGTMNSGKTTALLQVAHNYEEKKLKVLVIKSSIDKKGEDAIVSRLGINRKVDLLLSPEETIKDKINLENIKCILVDEVQFMTKKQIIELWIISKKNDIPIICYGLKTNFKGELFDGSKALIEVADEIDELVTICECGKKAKFNARIVNGDFTLNGDEVAIDGIDAAYIPLCGKCYIEKVLKK